MLKSGMSNYGRSPGILSHIPRGVQYLLLGNIFVYILQHLYKDTRLIERYFTLQFYAVWDNYYLWQIFSYMFLHGGGMHIFFNMLMLYMLGTQLENYWGTRTFIKYYLFCGIGAGSVIFAIDLVEYLLNGNFTSHSTLGASGAIYGLLLAYGVYYPNREVLFMFVIPVRIGPLIVWTVILSAIFIPLKLVPGISHSGHLGGILAGVIYYRLHKKDYHFRVGNNTLDDFFRYLRAKLHLPLPRRSHPEEPGFWERLRSKFSRNSQSPSNRNTFATLDETKMNEEEVEAKIDELIDKISEKGLRGLSIEEQLFLDRVSRHYRHKFPD